MKPDNCWCRQTYSTKYTRILYYVLWYICTLDREHDIQESIWLRVNETLRMCTIVCCVYTIYECDVNDVKSKTQIICKTKTTISVLTHDIQTRNYILFQRIELDSDYKRTVCNKCRDKPSINSTVKIIRDGGRKKNSEWN